MDMMLSGSECFGLTMGCSIRRINLVGARARLSDGIGGGMVVASMASMVPHRSCKLLTSSSNREKVSSDNRLLLLLLPY